jgi:hypothetical protein
MRPAWLAAGLLTAGIVHNTAHRYVPEDARGFVWNITGALLLAGLLLIVATQARSTAVWLVVALLVGHALQVAGCSVAYLWEPWPIVPGDDLCSDGLSVPLGTLGLVGVALLQGAHRGDA